MNDEIKEIDRIILNVKRKLQFSPEQRFVELFNKDEINILLDYITNLQHTEDLYNQLLKDYDELEQSYQELKNSKQWWNNRFNAVQRDYEDYKSRCEEAVEYIKENAKYKKVSINDRKYYSEYLINQVLDILNGKE